MPHESLASDTPGSSGPTPAAPDVEPKPTLQHRVEMLGVNSAAAFIRSFPLNPAVRLIGGLGSIAGGLFRVRRRVVDANLALAFPDASAGDRRALASETYRHLGSQAGVLFRMIYDDRALEEIVSRVVLADDGTPDVVTWLQDRSRNGKGTLVLTGHFGNWEIAGASLVRLGVPLDAVVTRQSNPLFDARIRRLRARLGIQTILRQHASERVPRALAEGKTVALVADQFTWHGVPIRFFGTPTLGARGPAVFARRAKVPTVLMSATAVAGSPTSHVFRLAHLDVDDTGSSKQRTQQFIQAYFDRLEEAIRANPEQYLWHHRRWRPLEGKVDPEELLALEAKG